MTNLRMTEQVKQTLDMGNKNQTWFFACSSRRSDAVIHEATFVLSDAKRKARAIGGCVRTGYYSEGKVVTL
jgi:molecular chaperone GrpE (heat shock protein)